MKSIQQQLEIRAIKLIRIAINMLLELTMAEGIKAEPIALLRSEGADPV